MMTAKKKTAHLANTNADDVGMEPPPLRERIIVEDVSNDKDDVDDTDVKPPPMGRGHRDRRPNARMPQEEILFLQTAFKELDDNLHFQFVQQAIKDAKEHGDRALLCKYVTSLVFNQISAKAGLK